VSLLEAQAALDDWVRDYNATRPHQALELREPVTPAERFQPAGAEERELLGLWLPGALASVPAPAGTPTAERALDTGAAPAPVAGGPVEFDRVVPPSGNLWAMGRQFWIGAQRAGQTVRFWAGVDVIHLSIAGARVKSLRSHLSVADLARLAQHGAVPAGPPPLPLEHDTAAIEVDRAINKGGIVSLAGRQVLAAEILGGRAVIVRIEPQTLMFLDPNTRELLRVRPNPLTPEQVRRLRGARPAGPPPRPRSEPVTVQRRVSATGVITVCRQHVALGRVHAGRTVRVHVSEHTLAIELDGETRTVRRTTTRPVVVIKASRPRRARATSTELSASHA
jgi:Integrase core domain